MRKKRHAKKVVALALVGLLAIGGLTGCGAKTDGKGNGKGKGSKNIEISILRNGSGTVWLDALIEAFEKKYPEYNVEYNSSVSGEVVTASFGLEDIDTVDLYMAGKVYDSKYLEPLNDVLDYTVAGESKSIKEKFLDFYLKQVEVDGKYYQLNYAGSQVGYVYNKDLFKKAGITQTPRTTDELILTCGILYDNGITPLCHYKTVGYYYLVDEVWFSQYNGYDNYYDFYQNPTKEKFLTEDGRYEAIKVHEKITTPNYTLAGSNSESHIQMQTMFLEGECAMMVNGSWLSNEMGGGDKLDIFTMMKTPVISSITDKLTTVKNDVLLRKLITAIDNVSDGIESVDVYKDGENYLVDGNVISAADWDYVKIARNSIAETSCTGGAYIPTYSDAKEGAKDFLRFMYSDEGIKCIQENYHVPMPIQLSEGEIDTSNWNQFELEQLNLQKTAERFVSSGMSCNHRLFIDGGATSFVVYDYINRMCSNNESGRVNAKETWDEIVKSVNENYDVWLGNIK